MKLNTITFIILFIGTGCTPQILINNATGETVTCKMDGFPPGLNRRNCIEQHEALGWSKVTEHQAKEAQESIRKVEKLASSVQACGDNIKTNPSLQVIAEKIALGGSSEQSFSHLTNTNKPSPNEKAAISIYADTLRNCTKEYDKLTEGLPPPIIAVNHSSFSAIQNLLASLYKGDLTYGDFAKLRKQVFDRRESALAEIDQELRKNAEESNARAQQIAAQNAIAQAQASQAISSSMIAGAAMANAYKPYIPSSQTSQTSTLNRNTNCTTSVLGDTLRTTCN